MTVTFVDVATSGAGSFSSPFTITQPAGIAANQVAAVLVFFNDTVAVTGPSGFGLRESTTWLGASSQQFSFTKLLSAGEPTWTLTWGGGGSTYISVIALTYSGCDSSSATAHLIDSTANTGTGTTATGLGITATRADSMLIWHAISGTGARSGAPTPGSWTNRATFDTNHYADELAVAAGATGNFTSTYPSQEWVVHLLGLQGPEGSAGSSVTNRMLTFGHNF